MANNIDFKLKNAVEVGGPTKVTLGSITSSDIDLATGNYFADTLAANTTYTLSNAGDVQAFQLEVTGGVIGYDLSVAAYDNKSFSVASQSTGPIGFYIRQDDGLKLYVTDGATDSIYQYTLSTAWDISTASYDSVSLNAASQDTAPFGISFKPDGTKLYIAGSTNDSVFEYTLSTPWDLSTASYSNNSFDVSSQEATPNAIAFKPDGTKMYVGGPATDALYQYTLSTAWDVSTASYDSVTLSLSSFDTAIPKGIYFNPEGTELFISGNSTDTIYKFNLSTAWDLSTATDSGVSFDVSALVTTTGGVMFKPDGSKMYVLEGGTDVIYQYSTGTDSTLTWPSSIEWAGGIAPAAPANGETDVYTLVTDDGGTSYVGVKTADNLS